MRRILLFVLALIMISVPSFAIVDWNRGDGTDAVKGTDNASDIDYNITNYIQDPIDRQLKNHIRGCTLTRTSATVITVSAGEVTCMNGAGTIKRMRENTATTTMTMTTVGTGGIDSGSAEAVSTWYNIYAVADAEATTFTAIATQQGTALSDVTYYAYIGSVYNDAASDLKDFFWTGDGPTAIVMWNTPVQITTVVSAGAWSAATSCSAAMPSSSTLGIFGVEVGDSGGNIAGVWIRPNGSTWGTNSADGNFYWAEPGTSRINSISGQRVCFTDSSQGIQYYNHAGDTNTAISVQGYYLNR